MGFNKVKKIGRPGSGQNRFKDPNFLKFSETGAPSDVAIRLFTITPKMIENNIGSINLIQISSGDPYLQIVGTNIKVTFFVEITVSNGLGFDISGSVGMYARKKAGGSTSDVFNDGATFTIPAGGTVTKSYSGTWDISATTWTELIDLYPAFSASNVTENRIMAADIIIELL